MFHIHKCLSKKCPYYLSPKKSIIGYRVSDTRSTGPYILAMRMAFDKFKTFPGKALKFVADGYTAYPLATQQFNIQEDKEFNLIQVIGLTNDDAVSTEFRWVKQVVERMNRTFKSSYRNTNGYNSDDGALYGVSLWVAYYNFLRPHPYTYWKPLNQLDEFSTADNMPTKWQCLIKLGQQRIYQMLQCCDTTRKSDLFLSYFAVGDNVRAFICMHSRLADATSTYNYSGYIHFSRF